MKRFYLLAIGLLVFFVLPQTTKAQVFPSNITTPIPIPDDVCATTIRDTIEVTGLPDELGVNINLDSVCLTITHGWAEDVLVSLIAPDGSTQITLIQDVGGAGDNFTNTCLSDGATTPIGSGSPPFTGSFIPITALSSFNGIDPNGEWQIEACDDEAAFSGTLDDWELRFGAPPTCPAPGGLVTSDTTDTGATTSWNSTGSPLSYLVYVVPNGVDPSTTSPVASTTDTFYIYSSGAPATDYDWFVRAVCAADDTSSYAGPGGFATPCPDVLPGDSLQTAIVVPSLPYSDIKNTSICYTNGFSGNSSADVFYKVTPTEDGLLTATTCSGTTDYDTYIRLLDMNGNELVGDDDDPSCPSSGLQSTVSFDVTAGTMYFVLVEGFSGDEGQFEVNISFDPCGGEPSNLAVDTLIQTDCTFEITVTWENIAATSEVLFKAIPPGDDPANYPYTSNGLDSFLVLFSSSPYDTVDVYVANVCQPGDTTDVAGPLVVKTPPCNDICTEAIMIDSLLNPNDTCNLTLTQEYDDEAITFSADQGSPSGSCSDGDSEPKDLWYKMTVPASGVIVWEFIQDPGVSTLVELYTGTCGGLTPLSPVNCSNADSRTFTNLTPGTIVYFRVWDFNSDDSGTLEFCIGTIDCPAPGGLTASNITSNSATVSWNPLNSASSYLLYVGTNGFDPDTVMPMIVTDTFKNLSGLMESTTYDFYVRAECENGDTSSYSPEGTFATPAFCTTVQNVFLDSITDASIGLSWTPVTNATEYLLKIGLDGFDPDTATCVSVTDTNYVFMGLEGDTDYDIYILSVCTNDDTTSAGPILIITPCADIMGDFSFDPIIIDAVPYTDIRNIDTCYNDNGGLRSGADVWYKITTGPFTDSLFITTCKDTTDFDTYVSLADMDFSVVALDDDDPGCGFSTLTSTFAADVEPNTMYFIVVEAFSSATILGTYELMVTETTFCPPVLNLSGTLTTDTYSASDTINFDGVVPIGVDVLFSAPNININANAEVDGELLTEETGCN